MGYKVIIECDRCGCGYQWKDETVNISTAKKLVRNYGWQVGKKGWICPDCKKGGKK